MTVEQREELIKYCYDNVDYDTKDMKIRDLARKSISTGMNYGYKPTLEMMSIERFLMGFPIMVYTLKKDNGYEIINKEDDFYKIVAIKDFMDGRFPLYDLKILTCCSGLFFKDLPVSFQRKLENYTVRVVEFYDVKDNKIINFLEGL